MIALAFVMAAVVSAGEGEPNVTWINAYEAASGAIDVPVAGTYTVWAWAREDAATTLTLGKKEMAVAEHGKKEKRFSWVKAGNIDVKPGKVKANMGACAAIVLSANEAFRPQDAMGDMRVFDQPERVHDRRAETVRHTDTVYTMPEFATLEEWEAFAPKLRKRILLSSGLLPLPERTPLNANVFDRVTHDDYTVEKVHFEARPGFLVTGNLYRPVGGGPFPGVVCPHGHWEKGRIEDGERGSVPGRCITLARMGIVAFSYDMEGYNDSKQFKNHRWVSEAQKLWGVHPFAVQLWSSIRAVDFVQGLPDVDAERIACTGASGGGTQTFALMAVDPRVKVAAPVNMISSTMQGGCICENAPIIRFDNSNMEIGALMAPRPLLLVSATGDWTRETPRVEFPAIRSIYRLCGAEDRVANVHVDAGHNYNKTSREAVYRFFGRWLLDEAAKYEDFTEPDFKVEETGALRVFADDKLPEGVPSSGEVIAQTIASTRAKWAKILPSTAVEAEGFRDEYGDLLGLTIGAEVPEANDIAPERVGFDERGGYVVERLVLHRPRTGDAVPAILYRAADPAPRDTVLIVHGKGKAALANFESRGPGPLVAGLMEQDKAVMVIDTFLIGEHHSPLDRTVRSVLGSFSDTFQPTDTACRIQDVLTALAYLRSRRDLTDDVDLVGLEKGGIWCLFAAALDGQLRSTIVDANRFDKDDDEAWVKEYYMPCIRSVGDVDTAAALIAPGRLTVFNAGTSFADGIGEVYQWAPGALSTSAEALDVEGIVTSLKSSDR